MTCPLHGSQFNVCTGALLRGPAQVPLKTYSVIVEGDIGRVEAAAAVAKDDLAGHQTLKSSSS